MFDLINRGSLPQAVREEFEHLAGRLRSWTSAEHNDDGTHIYPDVTAIAYNAGLYSGTGSLVWTVDRDDQTMLQYLHRGREVIVDFAIRDSTVAGTGSVLKIRLPDGLIPQGFYRAYCQATVNGAPLTAYSFATENESFVNIALTDNSNWSASTDATTVAGSLRFIARV